MEDVNIEEVRAAAAVAVASTLVDNVQRERRDNSGKVFKYPPPPPFIRAVLLIQAFVRRRAFLRSFGQPASGEIDEEILELAPPRPLMSLALNFVRRLKSFRWVNVEREATLVAGLVDAQAARITMRDVSAVVNYYQDKVPKDHLSLNVLQEALDRQVIVAKEALQERASTLTTPVAIVEAMEQVIEEFQVPPEREDRVLDQTRLRLKRIVSEAEESLRKELAESSTTPAIDAVGARLREEFGPVASAVEEEIKVARLRRVQFLEMELETRWARPFVGPLPPHSAAARRYELELGKKNPKVIAFVAEETAHAATLEADLEVELSTLQKKVRELMKKRMEARARALIQDFDEKLADTFAQIQEVIEKAIVNIGPDNPKVKKRAQELLSPEAMMSLPLQEGQESAPATKPAPEPLPEASQRAEFPEEFADINLEPPLPPPSEGPLPAPPMETQRPAEKQREILQGGRAEMDPDLELEDEDLWGEPVGFSELISINDQVWDPRKLELEEEKARISFEPDPQQVLHLTALAAEDDSPEMEQKRADQAQLERERGEQKERTAVLTLEDLTMDTVAMHTEDVFKLKFIRSIAEALQIPKHRVKVNGFAPGSVKVLLSILEPTGDEPDDEDGRSRISADRALEELFAQVEDPNSRLRLGEVGPFVAAARLDRDIIPSAQVNVGSMADAYLASSLQGDDFELSDPWGESTAKRSEEVVDTAEQMAQTAQQSVGTRWGSSRMEHGSLQAESQFRSTCPHSKEDGTLAAWAIPYEKQPMYTFYDKSSEQIAKESLVRLPQDKVKVTMTASFHLTRHPASGTDTLKGKVPPAGGVKVFSADTWLDKEHLGMKDPTIRPGDVDLEETMKKKTDTLLPSDEEEEVAPAPDTPQRPTSATSTSVASDASSNTRKRKGSKKKRGKKGEDSQELSGDGQATSPEDSRETPEGAETGSKTGSLEDAEADSDAGRKTPKTPKKKAGKKKGAAGADDMGQTADSFASVASMATDESEADSPKAARKKKAEATQKAKAKSKDGRRASEGRRTSETIKVEAPPPVMGSADAEDEVMVPGKDASAKSRASPKRAGHSPKRQADKKNPAEGGKDMPDNLDGLGGSFATQFCWAGMYGGMNGTGLRPRWKDNPRLPQLVGKPATDDLHTPCFVRHAYRHGTVTVGPPYKVAEAFDQTSPAWCAAKMLDASIQKADWVRSYSKILQERDPKLGPDVNIRVASRSFSLPKVAARAKPRARPTARSASADRLPEDGKKDRRASRGSDVVHEGGTQVADAIDTSLGKPSSKTPKTKHEEEDKKKKKDKDKKKKEKKKGKGDEDGDDEGKKKKDKKKKDKKKDKGETGDLDDSGIVAEELGDGASEAGEPPFELLPSVGTWLTPLFLEPEELEEVARPGTGESSDYQQSVGESDFSATFGTEAVVADNVLAAAFGDVPYRVLQLPVPKADSATGEEASESSTVIGAQAAIVHAIQQAALAEEQMQGEAGQPQEAVDTPFQFRPSSGTMMLPLPQVAWELPQESEVVPPAASRDPTVVSEHPPGSEVVPPASRDPTVVSEHPPGSEVVPPASRDPTVVSEHPPGSEVAPQASRDPTVVSAHASGSEASVNSAVIGAQAAISHAIAQAARSEEARQGTQAESVISAAPAPSRPRSEIAEPPFEFLPSVAVSMLPLPYKVAVPVVAVPVEVYEPPAPEPPRMPVKRTPFTNAGAARREVSNFASSLTTSIFRDAKLGKRGYRGSSRSPSPGLGPPPQPADGGYPQGRSTDSSTAFASSQPPAEKAPLPGPPRTRPTEEPMQRPSLAATTPAGLAPRLQINAIPIKEGEEGL